MVVAAYRFCFLKTQFSGQDEVPRVGPKGPVHQPDPSLHAEGLNDRGLCLEAVNFIPQLFSAVRFGIPDPGSEILHVLQSP